MCTCGFFLHFQSHQSPSPTCLWHCLLNFPIWQFFVNVTDIQTGKMLSCVKLIFVKFTLLSLSDVANYVILFIFYFWLSCLLFFSWGNHALMWTLWLQWAIGWNSFVLNCAEVKKKCYFEKLLSGSSLLYKKWNTNYMYSPKTTTLLLVSYTIQNKPVPSGKKYWQNVS